MSNTLFTAIPPPSHTLSSHPIPPSAALKHIESYLAQSAQPGNAHLHPDCRFNERGPTLEGRAPGGGLILHQLGRVAKGLKGIRLVPQEESVAFQEGEAEVITQEGLNAADVGTLKDPLRVGDEEERVPDSFESEGVAGAAAGAGEAEEDFNEQMRGQGEGGIEEGELGKRNNIMDDGNDADVPAVERTDAEAKKAGKEKKRKRDAEAQKEEEDPEARKRAKKQRKEEKRRQEKEEAERQQHEAEADALTVEADDIPNGEHSQVNGISSQAFEIHGDAKREVKLERTARKEEKRAKKEAKRLAKEGKVKKEPQERDFSASSPSSRHKVNGQDRESQSPNTTKHRANEKRKRRRRSSSVEP